MRRGARGGWQREVRLPKLRHDPRPLGLAGGSVCAGTITRPGSRELGPCRCRGEDQRRWRRESLLQLCRSRCQGNQWQRAGFRRTRGDSAATRHEGLSAAAGNAGAPCCFKEHWAWAWVLTCRAGLLLKEHI